MDGIVLIDKKANITTTHVDYQCKKAFNTSKVGHAGTLDPFATGLVICGINKGTKLLTYLESEIKSYVAILKLGSKTDTGDLDGRVIKEKEVGFHTKESIKNVLDSLVGKQLQTPPMYSALKIDGKPLYEYARQGIELQRKSREVNIYSLELIEFRDNSLTFKAVVSKGTYIRTLGETIAEHLKEIGHLTYLRRLSIGDISVEKSYKVEDLCPEAIIPLEEAFQGRKLVVEGDDLKKASNGAKLILDIEEDLVMILKPDKTALAIYRRDEGTNIFRCEKGFM